MMHGQKNKKTHISCLITFFENHAVCGIM